MDLMMINLACMTLLDSENTIKKCGGTQVTDTQDFMCDGISRYMASEFPRVEFIDGSLKPLMREEPSKNHISTMMIKGAQMMMYFSAWYQIHRGSKQEA